MSLFGTVEYPELTWYQAPCFLLYGITLAETHKIRARYFAFIHTPPRDTEERDNICPELGDRQLATFIKLYQECYTSWVPNNYQFSLLVENNEHLNRLVRCPVCGLLEGSYCYVETNEGYDTPPRIPTPQEISRSRRPRHTYNESPISKRRRIIQQASIRRNTRNSTSRIQEEPYVELEYEDQDLPTLSESDTPPQRKARGNLDSSQSWDLYFGPT